MIAMSNLTTQLALTLSLAVAPLAAANQDLGLSDPLTQPFATQAGSAEKLQAGGAEKPQAGGAEKPAPKAGFDHEHAGLTAVLLSLIHISSPRDQRGSRMPSSA